MEILSPQIYSNTSCNKRFVSSKEVPKLSTGGLSSIFFRKLGETYMRPLHFEQSERIPDSLSVSAYSEILSPPLVSVTPHEKFLLLDQGIEQVLKEGAIKVV